MTKVNDPIDAADNDDDCREAWCVDFVGHQGSHEFCVDHRKAWCRICDGFCVDCLHDPHCRYCHVALNEEFHDWDCPYANGDE